MGTCFNGTGQDSWFGSIVIAKGGAEGGLGYAGAGSTAGGVGTIVYRGGNGSTGTVAGSYLGGGGGGGGAGTTGAGGDAPAASQSAGTGTSISGGNGGAGGSNSNGSPGNSYGGGGGGGGSLSGGVRNGGNGAQGRVEISW